MKQRDTGLYVVLCMNLVECLTLLGVNGDGFNGLIWHMTLYYDQ